MTTKQISLFDWVPPVTPIGPLLKKIEDSRIKAEATRPTVMNEALNVADSSVHPFERAGLGKAPFHFTHFEEKRFVFPDGTSKAGSSCDYCGTGIVNCYWIASADHKSFKVGSECVYKTGDQTMIGAVKKQEKALSKLTTKARETAKIAEVQALFAKMEPLLRLTPSPRGPSRGTAYDYGAWILVNAGTKGKLGLLKYLKKKLQKMPPEEVVAPVYVPKPNPRQEILEANPGLEAALRTDHRIVADLAKQFADRGKLSEKQIALAMKLAKEANDPSRQPMVPPITGKRQHVKGLVFSKQSFDTQFGSTTRIGVRVTTPEGSWITWGTVPRIPGPDGQAEWAREGDVIEFDAQLERGNKSDSANFKRPTNAAFVSKGTNWDREEESAEDDHRDRRDSEIDKENPFGVE